MSQTQDLAALAARLDVSKMQTVIDNFPGQIETALAQALPGVAVPAGGYRRIVIAGMGGSALPADVVLSAFEDRLTVPAEVVRHYVLPPSVDARTLVIITSFSGSTEETLAAVGGMPSDAQNVVVVSGGGQLRTLATERRYPYVQIPYEREPQGFQPRSAVGYFTTYFSRILAAAGLMPDPAADLLSAVALLRSISLRGDAERVARWLEDKIPVVYTDEVHKTAVARIVKIKFNENAKRPSFFNALPEANHNETIGFLKPLGRYGLFYMHDEASHERVLRRYEVMKKVFAAHGMSHVEFERWDMPGKTRLQKILASLAFAEQCSYYLALLDGFDPTPVDLVQEFKRELS